MSWVLLVSGDIGVGCPCLAWLGFRCAGHYDRPSPLPFVEGGDCEELLLNVVKRAESICIISAKESMRATRVSLLVLISVRSGSISFRIGAISACTMR